ncbi:diiron oxygenase [Streptomyces tricolor]|nr:diiron oxygenase [Streptomyces tricolor]
MVETLDNLVADATDHHYSPYTRFDWVDELAEEQWWMTPDLLTVAGTRHARELDEKTLMRLSKWESVNFFSLNIHGIRELLIEVTRRIHTRGFELPSEFFHRFLGEENGHMWFFAQFCLRYGGKIYPDKSLPVTTPEEDAAVANFLVFARILVFEELVDHFNIRMGRTPPCIPDQGGEPGPPRRRVAAHHHGPQARGLLYEPLRERGDRELRERLDVYLRRYITASVQSLYNPTVYRDAGIADACLPRGTAAGPGARRLPRDVLQTHHPVPGEPGDHHRFSVPGGGGLMGTDMIEQVRSWLLARNPGGHGHRLGRGPHRQPPHRLPGLPAAAAPAGGAGRARAGADRGERRRLPDPARHTRHRSGGHPRHRRGEP